MLSRKREVILLPHLIRLNQEKGIRAAPRASLFSFGCELFICAYLSRATLHAVSMRFICRSLTSSAVCSCPAATGTYRILVPSVAFLDTALVVPAPVLCHRLRLLLCVPCSLSTGV